MSTVDPTTLSGIYAIRHISGRVYIGSALEFAERWRIHKRDLKAGKHHSRYLQRTWDKYGEYEFVMVHQVADPEPVHLVWGI